MTIYVTCLPAIPALCYDVDCALEADLGKSREEVSTLARLCEVCGKSVWTGMQVSHSHIRTKRNWSPNVQKVRALVNGRVLRLNVCTRCLRSGKVQRAI